MNLSDIDKYIFVSIQQMENNILPNFDSELVKLNYFVEIMKNCSSENTFIKCIVNLIENYFNDNDIDRVSPCKYNIIKNGYPLAPIFSNIMYPEN